MKSQDAQNPNEPADNYNIKKKAVLKKEM